jgi:hypothetical protein
MNSTLHITFKHHKYDPESSFLFNFIINIYNLFIELICILFKDLKQLELL